MIIIIIVYLVPRNIHHQPVQVGLWQQSLNPTVNNHHLRRFIQFVQKMFPPPCTSHLAQPSRKVSVSLSWSQPCITENLWEPKKNVFFQALPIRGGVPSLHFFHWVTVLILDIKVMPCACFLVIFNNKMIKRTKIIITITTQILVVIFALLLDFVLCLK